MFPHYLAVMDTTGRQRIARRPSSGMPTFSYGQVEAALAEIYGAEDVQRKAFRGRLQNVRKLGIPKQQPGKGSRIRYTITDALFLMLALELSEFGLDPHIVARTLRSQWHMMLRRFQLAQQYPADDVYIAISTRLMSWSRNRGKSQETAMEIADVETALEVAAKAIGEPVRIIPFRAGESAALLKELQQGRQRFAVFNLSAKVRAVAQALGHRDTT